MGDRRRARPALAAARKLPRQRRSRLTVESILEAAARAFDQLGYERATTRRIADLAGVSVGSLYQYFRSRDALVAAVLERHISQVLDELGSRFRRHERADLPSLVKRLVAAVVDLHERHPALHAVLTENQPRLHRERLLKKIDRELASMFEAFLNRRPDLPRFDVRRAVFVLNRAFIALLHSGEHERAEGFRVEEDMVWLALGYLSSAAGAPRASKPEPP